MVNYSNATLYTLWSRVAYGLSALAFTLTAVTACLRTFELPARVVGMSGLEPLIFALSERCTNQLCYIPKVEPRGIEPQLTACKAVVLTIITMAPYEADTQI